MDLSNTIKKTTQYSGTRVLKSGTGYGATVYPVAGSLSDGALPSGAGFDTCTGSGPVLPVSGAWSFGQVLRAGAEKFLVVAVDRVKYVARLGLGEYPMDNPLLASAGGTLREGDSALDLIGYEDRKYRAPLPFAPQQITGRGAFVVWG